MRVALTVLAAFAACVTAVPACSGSDSASAPGSSTIAGEKGRLDLNLVVNGEPLNSVHLSLTSPALPASIEKDIDTSSVTGSIKAFAGLLPAGSYSATFTATTVSGQSCSGSTAAPVPVLAQPAPPASISIHIVCGTSNTPPTRGNANITADVATATQCPYLTQVFVAPTELTAGGVISLSALLSDTTGVFSWSAVPATGTFGNAANPVTTFTAASAGGYTVTATLAKAGCTDDLVSTPVTVHTGTGGAENICTPPEVPTDTVKCEACEAEQFCEGGCGAFTGADLAACTAVLNCIRRTGCAETTGVLECYCGPGVDVGQCRLDTVPKTGVCLNEILAAFPPGSPIGSDPSIPGGAAMALVQCDYSYCSYPEFGQGADHECMPYCVAP